MSTAAVHARQRPRLLALVRYTLRSCIPPRRWAVIVLPCIGAVLFGLLSLAVDGPDGEAFPNIAAEAIFGLVMPIVALVVGDAVMGAEVRAGTFQFTWLTPTQTWQIVLGRWIGGSLVILVTVGPACAVAAMVAGEGQMAWPAAVAGVCGGLAYVAVFIAVGCITRRTAVWSLAIGFLVERLLGAALAGIAQLSPTWESRAIFVGLLDDPPTRLVRSGIPQGGDAIARLAIVSLVMLLLANWRMRHLRLSGAAD